MSDAGIDDAMRTRWAKLIAECDDFRDSNERLLARNAALERRIERIAGLDLPETYGQSSADAFIEQVLAIAAGEA